MRNKVTSELQSAKRSYLHRLNPKKPKDFWRAMKYLNKQQSTIPTLVDEHEVEATSNIDKADMLNSLFSNVLTLQVFLERMQATPPIPARSRVKIYNIVM